ncbi:DCC1-like thiol-disulfide oxidoreductase family protein [Thermus sp.]|uniref:DCC1-like thiol-disulfide oxidoreductase family protein n=1 Tax=Thermus sp. TaxID=275 RepID=UPI00307EE883
MKAYIDERCPYCRAFGEALKRLDREGRIVFLPVGSAPEGDRSALLEALHVYEGERVHRGYGALLTLARALPPLWPLYPLLWLGGALGVGPWLYRAFARRRLRDA